MKRNKRLLLKTAKRIEEIPESYNQNEWIADSNRSPCGTVACLAGEIIICSERSVKAGVNKLSYIHFETPDTVAATAIKLAGLNEDDKDALFYSPGTWPNKIGKGFRQKSKAGKAKAAATLLRYLADGGKV